MKGSDQEFFIARLYHCHERNFCPKAWLVGLSHCFDFADSREGEWEVGCDRVGIMDGLALEIHAGFFLWRSVCHFRWMTLENDYENEICRTDTNVIARAVARGIQLLTTKYYHGAN